MLLPNRKGTGSLKYDGVAERFGDSDKTVLPMWLADMDFPPPDSVASHLNAYLQQRFGYQQGTINESVSNWYARRGIIVRESSIISCASILAGIANSIQTLSSPGDRIAVFSPSYGPLFSLVTDNDRTLVTVSMDGNPSIENVVDSGELPSDINMVILCNPNNPTGHVMSAKDLSDLAQFCTDRRVPLLVDEVHSEFIHTGSRFVSALSLPAPLRECVVVAQSPNKAYNLAHLPAASYLVINNLQWAKWVDDRLLGQHLYAGDLACAALAAAYHEDNDPWLSKVISTVNKNRLLFFDALKKTPLVSECPRSTCFFWLDLSSIFPKECNVADALYRATGLATNEGSTFGQPGFVRLNLATSQEVIEEALARIETLIHSAK